MPPAHFKFCGMSRKMVRHTLLTVGGKLELGDELSNNYKVRPPPKGEKKREGQTTDISG